ncbi:unnamed protein product [Caenorhabditis auriculariae]|uniref:Neurotransmitter-gated ion-channel ligand-binding domain-containing protein n=1 Tax=Caenorhabditis auriculariae TaxID=2777116 RepID=A0A8S1HS76_9PELO|nr:unnamed protein product [Caenorhabditis auriculariae]
MNDGTFTLMNLLSLALPFKDFTGTDLQRHYDNEMRLIRDLSKNPNLTQPLTKLPAKVMPYFVITHVHELDQEEQVMMLSGSLTLMWLDDRLEWNMSEYGQISELSKSRFGSFGSRQLKIWVPNVHVTDLSSKTEAYLAFEKAELLITNSGMVRATVNLNIKTTCSFDVADYPDDTQNCTFSIYSPLAADVFQFTRFGGVVIPRAAPAVDVADFVVDRIDSSSMYLAGGYVVVKNVEKWRKLAFLRSINRYNIVFKRKNVYYRHMAMQMFCISAAVNVIAILPTMKAVVLLLMCLMAQVLHAIYLFGQLPPAYVSLPRIVQVGMFLMLETVLLMAWRSFCIHFRQHYEVSKKNWVDYITIADTLVIFSCFAFLIFSAFILF